MKFKWFSLIFLPFFLTFCSDEKIDDDMVSTFKGEIEWVKTFGGSREDEAVSITETPDGGFVVLGHTLSIDGDITTKTTIDADYWLLKVDSNGHLLWQKTFGGSQDDRATKVITTQDGGLAVIGFSRSNDGDVSNNNGFYDFWFIKLTANGQKLWEKSYGYDGNDQGQSLIQTTDGGYFLAGFMDYEGFLSSGDQSSQTKLRHGVGEFWGVKTDPLGNMSWHGYYGGSNNDRAYDVTQTPDGGFILVGHSESDDFNITNPFGSYDYWVVKIDANGQLIWQKNFGGSGIEIAYNITKSNDNHYYILGDSRSSDAQVSNPKGNADFWLLKIDDNGQLKWQKSYGGTQFDSGRKVIEKSNGELILFGNSRSSDVDVKNNHGQNDFWLVMTNKNGQIIFEKNYGGSRNDFGFDAIISQQGHIVMVGSSESSDKDVSLNKGNKDVMIVKLKK